MYKFYNTFITIFIISMFGLSGCMVANVHSNYAVGKLSSAEDARAEIKQGMTMKEVIAKWGEPRSRKITEGTTYWTYQYYEFEFNPNPFSTLMGTKRRIIKVVSIAFVNGRVVNVRYEEEQEN